MLTIYNDKSMIYIITILIVVIVAELAAYFLIKYAKKGLLEKKIAAFQSMPYDFHPYLSFVYKGNGYIPEDQSKTLLLNRDKNLSSYGIHLNSIGFGSGPDGMRNVELKKPEGVIARICCIGESTTASYINFNNIKYSYPNELEKTLNEELGPGKVEVVNFGQGSWSSVEIMMNMILRVCDLRPDYVIMLLGYNDIPIALSPDFKSDYSHAKINIYKYQYSIQRLSRHLSSRIYLIKIGALLSYRWLLNISNDIGAYLNTSKPDYDLSFDNLAVFRRNIEVIVGVCQSRNMRPVLLTYPYYSNRFNKHIKSAIVHKRALDVVNEHIRGVAKSSGAMLIDAANEFPLKEGNFTDSMHYSEEGTMALAELVHVKLIASLKSETGI